MKVFLAGIIQGSKVAAEIHNQDWRTPIRSALERHLSAAEIYCHYTLHPNSIAYDLDDIRSTFTEGLRRAAESDLLIAYVPTASMGTAIEMHEGHHAGATVITISPLTANWVIRTYSDRVFPDIDAFERFCASGQLAALMKAKKNL